MFSLHPSEEQKDLFVERTKTNSDAPGCCRVFALFDGSYGCRTPRYQLASQRAWFERQWMMMFFPYDTSKRRNMVRVVEHHSGIFATWWFGIPLELSNFTRKFLLTEGCCPLEATDPNRSSPFTNFLGHPSAVWGGWSEICFAHVLPVLHLEGGCNRSGKTEGLVVGISTTTNILSQKKDRSGTLMYYLPSQSLTWFTWKWHHGIVPNLETIIFRFHVPLQGCTANYNWVSHYLVYFLTDLKNLE